MPYYTMDAQLASKRAIIHHNQPNTYGERKFSNLCPAQYTLSGKWNFLWWMSYWLKQP